MLGRLWSAVRHGNEWKLGRRGSFAGRFAIDRWQWAIAVLKFNDDPHWTLHLFCLWVTLGRARTPPKDVMLDSWGFRFHFRERYLALNWGHRHKQLHFPWALEWCKTEWGTPGGGFVTVEQASRRGHLYLRGDGRMTPAVHTADKNIIDYIGSLQPADPGRYREEFTYRYIRKSGEVQIRNATVTVERMTWTWRLCYRLGLYPAASVSTSIWVEFSDEVGERTGSWKGGTVGCGWDLLPHESPRDALSRMERERKFE